MKRPSTATLLLLVSLVLVLAASTVIFVAAQRSATEPEVTSVGSRPSASETSRQSAPSGSVRPSAVDQSPASATPTAAPTSAGRSTAAALPEPVRVRIPRIAVDADVVAVGLDPIGAMELPEDITEVGWYELGVPPGADRGSAVLAAHRDGRVQGHGVFYDLGQLDVGNRVAVSTADGTTLAYRVVSRELIAKKRLPLEELFAVDGPPRLTLISCGGYYDRNNGGYQDNVVVTAVPIG